MKSKITLYSAILVFAVLIIAIPSCIKDSAPGILIKNDIALTGQQEVPSVSTPGKGVLHIWYTKSIKTITYTIDWQGLTSNVTAIRFNSPASPGEVASQVLEITGFPPGTNGSISGDILIKEADEQDLVNGKWYLNLHTSQHQQGEVRGQIVFD